MRFSDKGISRFHSVPETRYFCRDVNVQSQGRQTTFSDIFDKKSKSYYQKLLIILFNRVRNGTTVVLRICDSRPTAWRVSKEFRNTSNADHTNYDTGKKG